MQFAVPLREPNSAAQPLITRTVEEKPEEPFELPWTRPAARVIGPQAQSPLSFSGKEGHGNDKSDQDEWIPETDAEEPGEEMKEERGEEARFEGTTGRNVRPFPIFTVLASKKAEGDQKKKRAAVRKGIPGIKKRRGGKSADQEDMPPTPWGCEWVKANDGWSLWRVWWVRDVTGEKVKMSRYAGTLSYPAWHVMKEYDDEKFISIIGQRIRRYGKR
jgi:hypothetical protein